MVTRLDIFKIVYEHRTSVKPIEVVRKLHKTEEEYDNIHKILRELVKDNFLIKTKKGFYIYRSNKINLLYSIINYCMENSINYNWLINKKLAEFIYKALGKKEIQQKDFKINARTFKKYLEILNRYGLLLIISRKPLKARIFFNTLINNILIYFEFKKSSFKDFAVDYLITIEKELKLFQKLRAQNEIGYKKLIEEFEREFVYHSLSLEGNPITLPDTIKILKQKITPENLKIEDVDEVKDYQEAILQMFQDVSNNKKLTKEEILEYHRLAMRHKPNYAGIIRTRNVYIKGNPNFKIAKLSEIEPKLKDLLIKYNEFIKRKNSSIKNIINFGAYFHNEFQHIHPFYDGNSRITRLITFHLLHAKGIPILDIPLGLLDEYLSYTKGSKKRDDNQLYRCLQRIILFNLKKINEKLGI